MLFADEQYLCPSRDWILNSFAPAFAQFKRSIGLTLPDGLVWRAEKFDCDNFTRLAASYADFMHCAQSGPDAGLAFGEFWYTASFGAHAINLAIVAGEGNKPELLFFEPQECRRVLLTEKEIQSCRAVRF